MTPPSTLSHPVPLLSWVDAHHATPSSPAQVPEIVWAQTRPRVLTMAFEEGVCATDVPALRERGLPLDKVAHLISSVFCEQVGLLLELSFILPPLELSRHRFNPCAAPLPLPPSRSFPPVSRTATPTPPTSSSAGDTRATLGPPSSCSSTTASTRSCPTSYAWTTHLCGRRLSSRTCRASSTTAKSSMRVGSGGRL